MNFGTYDNGPAYYEPNSYEDAPKEQKDYLEPDLALEGVAQRHVPLDNRYYEQPRALFGLMNASQKEQLFNNIAGSMEGVDEAIIQKALAHFEEIHKDYAEGVRKALKK